MLTFNDTTMNVNRFEHNVCELRTESLRGKSSTAGNKKITAYFLKLSAAFGRDVCVIKSHRNVGCFVSTVDHGTRLAHQATGLLPSLF